jgi:hypothetical protein
MGPDGHLRWTQFWATLIHKTEVGEWGHSGRFRPAYYVFRVGETALFGDNPHAWYACVLVVFAGACALLGFMTALWVWTAVDGTRAWICWAVVVFSSAAGSFLFVGLYAWSGIVGRLGPAELLGLAAAAAVLLALTKLSLGLGRLWWVPALLGVTAATFAKESFSSLALALPLVGGYVYVAHGRRKLDLAASLLGLVPPAILGAILGPKLLGTQHDVYDMGVGASRLSGAISALSDPPLRQSLIAGSVLLLAWLAVAVTVPRAEWSVLGFLLAVILWLFACLFFDDWFYGGNYALPRYRAIPDLVMALQFVGAMCLSIAAVARSRRQTRGVPLFAIASLAVSSLFLFHAVSDSVSGIRLTHEAAIRNAATSNEYQHGLSEVLARLSVEPRPSVAVVARRGIDYEPAFAVLNELGRRSRDHVHEYLIMANSSPKPGALVAAMTRISRNGARDWQTRPLSELGATGAEICVFLNERPHPVEGCHRGGGVQVVAQGM